MAGPRAAPKEEGPAVRHPSSACRPSSTFSLLFSSGAGRPGWHADAACPWLASPGHGDPGQPAVVIFDCRAVTAGVQTLDGWLFVVLQMAAVM